MGYTITIGQAEPVEPEELEEDVEYEFSVASIELPDAPAALGDTNPHRNYRWPSYSQWEAFAHETGLYAFFYGDPESRTGGLMRPHPGTLVLRQHHAETVRGALKAYRAKHPDAVARFDEYPEDMPWHERAVAAPQHPDCDYALARLEWLSWWIDWALANCSRPAMRNT